MPFAESDVALGVVNAELVVVRIKAERVDRLGREEYAFARVALRRAGSPALGEVNDGVGNIGVAERDPHSGPSRLRTSLA
ncbi:MAG TPA: hypothetical protein PLF56_09550, partial [Micropruina sp.]|nr:hypothetical protein [Micropruina sp.]